MSSEKDSGNKIFLSVAETPFGYLRVLVRGERIERVFLPSEELRTSFPEGSSEIAESIMEFLRGERDEIPLRMNEDGLTGFQRRVFKCLSGVPRGMVTTYGALAEKLETRPRAVARALAANIFPLIIPCHRVVRSDGSLGGYSGEEEMKEWLLRMEGVPVKKGRVPENLILRRL
ncbi:MAG: methylated-DNA--[protein]-cysteine S-methyltransferase [Archaeoglobi archaeon]|nr:methylated-DNA--[protein]-cysteine S-methyltransferase [Candidatus Mnemosynella bozhongmuii]